MAKTKEAEVRRSKVSKSGPARGRKEEREEERPKREKAPKRPTSKTKSIEPPSKRVAAAPTHRMRGKSAQRAPAVFLGKIMCPLMICSPFPMTDKRESLYFIDHVVFWNIQKPA